MGIGIVIQLGIALRQNSYTVTQDTFARFEGKVRAEFVPACG